MRLLLLGRELKGKSILLLILLLHCRQVPFAASLKPCDAMWFFQQKKKKNLSITADYAFSSIWERAFNETWGGFNLPLIQHIFAIFFSIDRMQFHQTQISSKGQSSRQTGEECIPDRWRQKWSPAVPSKHWPWKNTWVGASDETSFQ